MKTKITQFIPALVVLLAIGFGDFSQWCTGAGQICFRTVLDRIIPEITYPLYFFTLYSLPLAIILILIPRHLFNSWLKLALWAIPLSFIFIAMTPVNSNAYMDFFPFYRDDAARLSAEVLFVASLVWLISASLISRFTKGRGGDEEKIKYETRELKALISASIGFMSFVIFLSELWFDVSFDLSGTFLILAGASLATNAYALYSTVLLWSEGKHNRTPVSKRLILTRLLLGISILGYMFLWYVLTLHI